MSAFVPLQMELQTLIYLFKSAIQTIPEQLDQLYFSARSSGCKRLGAVGHLRATNSKLFDVVAIDIRRLGTLQ